VQRLFFAAAVLALASGGCATGHATTAVLPTPLDVPSPPPRVLAPPAPEAPPTEVQGINTEPRQLKPKPPTPTSKPETKTDPALPPALPAVTPPPVATLQQTQPDKAAGQTEKQVRDQLSKAKADLQRVNRGRLNADEKSQYDTAQRFVAEAQQALKEGNLVFAAKVAEKAAGLAAGLPVR
jgi:hypothetical protein